MRLTLLSGGLDSSVCYRSCGGGAALFVDYGQPVAEQELASARLTAGNKLHIAKITGLNLAEMDGSNAGPQVVVARNAILLSLAANVASGLGLNEIVIGCNADDFRDYDDCRSAYLDSMRDVLAPLGIRLRTPLLLKSKREILAIAGKLGITGTWSCYTPGEVPCGRCASCASNAS